MERIDIGLFHIPMTATGKQDRFAFLPYPLSTLREVCWILGVRKIILIIT
jgi:hypothetical protein